MDQNNNHRPVVMPIGPKVEPIADTGPPPESVTIPRNVLALAAVAADTPYRYAINCLKVEAGTDGRHRAISTNGKALALVDWQESADRPLQYTTSGIPAGGGAVLIPASAVEAARKASAPRRGEREGADFATLKQQEDGGPVLIARGAAGESVLRAGPTRPATDFPPYADEIPGPDDNIRRTVVAVDVELLADLAAALCRAAAGPKAKPCVYLSVPVDAAHAPILVSPTVDPARCESPLTRALGILMPLAAERETGRP